MASGFLKKIQILDQPDVAGDPSGGRRGFAAAQRDSTHAHVWWGDGLAPDFGYSVLPVLHMGFLGAMHEAVIVIGNQTRPWVMRIVDSGPVGSCGASVAGRCDALINMPTRCWRWRCWAEGVGHHSVWHIVARLIIDWRAEGRVGDPHCRALARRSVSSAVLIRPWADGTKNPAPLPGRDFDLEFSLRKLRRV